VTIFQIYSPTGKRLSFPKNAANIVKIGLAKLTLRVVEVIHYVTDTVEGRQCDKKTSHFVASQAHTDVRCSISANLWKMLEEFCDIISHLNVFRVTSIV